MSSTVDLDALRTLIQVGRSGSISAAAQAEGISQQAASARLRALESRCGARLVDRSGRRGVLTAQGTLTAQWAEEVFGAVQRFEEALDTLRASPGETLRIAASLTIAEYLLPAWLVRLRELWVDDGRAAPDVRLRAMNSTDAIAAVRAGEADLGFVETPLPPAHLAVQQVGLDELVVVVPPTHPWAGTSLTPRRLAATRLVVRESGSGTRLALETLLDQAGAGALAEPAAEFSSTAGVRAAALAGVAPAALSILAVRDDLALGRLVAVRLRGLRLVRPLSVVSRGTPDGAASALIRIAGTGHRLPGSR